MKEEALQKIEPLLPLDFFSLSCDVAFAEKLPSSSFSYRKYILPDTSSLLHEDTFGEMALAWNEKGLLFKAILRKPYEETFFPDFGKGDSLELFIDTRDVKTAGFATKFCHHFVILPEEVQGIRAQEITHFREEDSHPLCDPTLIGVEAEFKKNSYELSVTLPAACLHGYDPASFDRLGFSYRMNRPNDTPQHFSVSSKFYSLHNHPSLWSSLTLKKG